MRRLLVLLWAAVGVPAAAKAHLGHEVQRAERYLKLDVEPERVRIVVSLTLGPQETERVMRAADGDEDGTLTEEEADLYMRQWSDALVDELPVWVDGVRVTPQWDEHYLDPLGPPIAAPGAVEVVAAMDLDGGAHEVRIHDSMALERFDRTDVVFRAQDGVTLEAAGIGEQPEGVRERLFFGREERSDPRYLSARFTLPGMTAQERWLAAGGGAALVLLALLAWWRVQKKS